MSDAGPTSLKDAAARVGVKPQTLRRWAQDGVVPRALEDGWTEAAVAHARVVARLRERGHSLKEIRAATREGKLAFSYVEDLLPPPQPAYTLEQAAEETGLEPGLIARIYVAQGFTTRSLEQISEDDLQLLRYIAAVLAAGLPLVALLQLVRVYGQALAQVADAEVRLFHLYVHEPLMRNGVPGTEMTEEMGDMVRDLLPLSSPIMDHLHQRYLAHFLEQDVIGHMEADLEGELDLGRMRVTIGFADLAGYTKLTEEAGEEEAVSAVERFLAEVEATLPDDARIIKTIGDGAMIVGSDAGALVDWAVGFQQLQTERPLPRIGLHTGATLYRDGDYFGREVNLASRVAARAAGGEVIVTRPIVSSAGSHLEFEPIGEVRLKGFNEATELFVARQADPDD
jgi:adenylate cyclase